MPLIRSRMDMVKNYILDKSVAAKKLKRMAYEILENNVNEEYIILAGIRESGSIVARNIQNILSEISKVKNDLITITLNKHKPKDVRLNQQLDFKKKVIIVND